MRLSGLPYVSVAGVATLRCLIVTVIASAPLTGDKSAHDKSQTNQLQSHRYDPVVPLDFGGNIVVNYQNSTGMGGRMSFDSHNAVQQRPRLQAPCKRSKSERHIAFAKWIVDTYDTAMLKRGSGVLDVAGGKGFLTAELSSVHGVPCTLIEPRPSEILERAAHGQRGNEAHLEHWQGMFTVEAIES